MATSIVSTLGKRTDDIFFSVMSVLILITVLLGFARSYFLAGVFLAPLPSLLVHLHGAAMSCWILLFIVQTLLIASRRVDLHRKLGAAGSLLAGFIVVSGLAVVFACVRRGGVPPFFSKSFFFADNALGFLLFGALVAWAIVVRKNGPAHKRLMLIATFNLVIPAVARWPFLAPQHVLLAIRLTPIVFFLLIACFDLVRMRKIHLATIGGAVVCLALGPVSVAVARTSLIQNLVGWLTSSA